VPSPTPTIEQRILDAASQLFLELGYQVGMDAVARRAGVSKQTVYAHFENKDALFRAASRAMLAPLHASMDPEKRSIEACLLFIGHRYVEHFADADKVALGRMLIAQAARFPRLAHALYETGPASIHQRLSERIADAMDRGDLRQDDPDAAAELFMAMLDGIDAKRRLLGVPAREPSAQDEWVRFAVNTFLRAFAPASPTSRSEQRNTA
jgi:TetR/AcrR family transcriptional regulator, mexJK operon transcriptional repressor